MTTVTVTETPITATVTGTSSAAVTVGTTSVVVTAGNGTAVSFPSIHDVMIYGAIGDGTTDDSGAIQDAIDAAYADGGGIVQLPAKTFLLGSSLVPKRGVTIRGVYPGATCDDGFSWDLGFTVDTGTILTYPSGVVFQQDTSAGVGTLTSLNGVKIESLGFKDVASVLVCGATNCAGLQGSVIRDLIASGVTGVAFDLTNILQVNMQNIRADCAQFIRITSDHDTAVNGHQPGNSYFADLYCYITTDGHDTPAIHLRGTENSGRGTSLNFIHMNRVQVNRMITPKETGSAHIYFEGTEHSYIQGCTFTGLDLEGEAEYNVRANLLINSYFDFVQVTDRESAPAMYLRNCQNINVRNSTYDFYMDIDATNYNINLSGLIEGVQGGGVRPLGMYTDRSVDQFRMDLHKRLTAYAYETPDYSNLHGSGVRTVGITVSTSGATMWGLMANSAFYNRLIDGSYSNGGYCNNGVEVVNEWMEFDFTTARLITEVNFKFSNAMTGGTFKWQGWNGSSWVDVDTTTFVLGTIDFTADGSANQFVPLVTHQAFTKIRYIGTTGNSSWDATWQEVQFKIGNPA
jgi:hypothetical protein